MPIHEEYESIKLLQPSAKDLQTFANKDSQMRSPVSQFCNFISPDPDAPFPADTDRYALYVHPSCPWAHRTNAVRSLKGLEDVIQLIVFDAMDPVKGWYFSGKRAGPDQDPLYGYKYIRELYFKADPNYSGRFAIPLLWDKVKETIVSNESGEIIRMFYSSFDAFIPESLRESSKGDAGLFPAHLRGEIEAMNDWVYNTINNGVYKTGFATTQQAYDENVYPLFRSLDRLEEHLSQPGHSPFLFGEHITEADIRLFPSLIRFDPAYHTIFRCNLKMIRHDYPRLHEWLRRLYWDENGSFRWTTRFDLIKSGYAKTMKSGITPAGPTPDILPIDGAPALDETREREAWLAIWGDSIPPRAVMTSA